MKTKLNDYIKKHQSYLNNHFDMVLTSLDIPKELKQSMKYSISAGGKRIRPILLIATYESCLGENIERVLSAATAIEFIHTYSLIHDDLPAMDDDDLRRGMPTNHVQFDEATAILAGDALLTYSFEMITNDKSLSFEEQAKLVGMLAKTSGPNGMVSGQILDMQAENKRISFSELEDIHTYKTGKLLSFSVYAGALLAQRSQEEIELLLRFSDYLGILFQLQDDILDVTGSEEMIGKPVGSDEGNDKSTYPKLLGLDGAIKQKEEYIEKAKNCLQKVNVEESYLNDLLLYVAHRDH